jgi:histidinol-phosphate aminotransferase
VTIPPRQAVKNLAPYHAPEEGRGQRIRLDFNENTQGAPAVLNNAGFGLSCQALGTYPEYQAALQELAQYYRCDVTNIMLTNGSDEALSLLASTYIEPKQDKALISSPTFQMIPHYLTLAEADIMAVPVTDTLEFDVDAMGEALKTGIKLVMLPSPDNPTGAELPNSILEPWLKSYPETLFVIDEAYAEYADETALSQLADNPNLVITRTFSKAWGLAGLRLGVVLAHSDIIQTLTRVRSPYNVNQLAVEALRQVLPLAQSVHAQATQTLARKQALHQNLANRGYHVHACGGNYLLLGLGVLAQDFAEFCAERGILIRYRGHLAKLFGFNRISIGTEAENKALLDALNDFSRNTAWLFDLDDTLVDTKESFPRVVQTLVEEFTGQALSLEAYYALKAKGGYNDDWDAAEALIQERGASVDKATLIARGGELYFQIANTVEHPLLPLELLAQWKTHTRLGIVTGRTRQEYERVWAERLAPYFDLVVCVDDNPSLKPKPSGEMLTHALEQLHAKHGVYVGNSVDDMQAAKAAGLSAIGIATTLTAEQLQEAGADLVLSAPEGVHWACQRTAIPSQVTS